MELMLVGGALHGDYREVPDNQMTLVDFQRAQSYQRKPISYVARNTLTGATVAAWSAEVMVHESGVADPNLGMAAVVDLMQREWFARHGTPVDPPPAPEVAPVIQPRLNGGQVT